ncbi:hypothetical protein Goshw_014918 [Gossypium schwendimanii]|uniref:Uncharacterized protein n=1 Tax=Gossypium schwendimanii TaxID=34291 RepID=A0A7J9MWH8_GOSSC|nr:hypothetical protein [Gossypium schwendimanii]
MENYFRAKGITIDAVKVNTTSIFIIDIELLWWRDVTEKEALLAFQNGLKLWVRQEVEQRGVEKLSEAMTVVESMVKLGLGKDKLGSSNGNGKPRVGKKKPKRKLDKLKCFLCDGPHMLKKCLKKFALKEKSLGKALCMRKSVIEGKDEADKEPKKLGLSKGKANAKRAKRSKKKRVKCFFCRGLYGLRNCPKQVVIKEKAMFEFVSH